MVDPGLAEDIARHVTEHLAGRLSHQTDEQWRVETIGEQLPLDSEGMINLADHAPTILDEYAWDYVFYLTDLPIIRDGQPVLCRTVAKSRGALIVLPALGAIQLRAQVLELVVTLLSTLSGITDGIDTAAVGRDIKRKNMVTRVSADEPVLALRGPFNLLRMLGGMVRGNRPVRLPRAMSGFLTAGAATGAFGIFYSSIWSLANELHPVRLVLIEALVIGLLTGWLVCAGRGDH